MQGFGMPSKHLLIVIFVFFISKSVFTTANHNNSLSETPAGFENKIQGLLLEQLTSAVLVSLGGVPVSEEDFQENSTTTSAFVAEIETLKDRMSILEKAFYQQEDEKEVLSESSFSDMEPLCKRGNAQNLDNHDNSLFHRNQVVNSIKRTLTFIGTHIEQLHTIEPAYALLVLKVVDDKHGGKLQKEYPLSDWISRACKTLRNDREANFCNALTKIWKSRQGDWKPESIIKLSGFEFKSIGSEKDVIWGRLNGECQLALLNRCEVPYICERTLFDHTPRSQYMLTHQLLQRIFAELGTCSATKDLIDQDVNHKMCAKIYKEAQLIHALKTPAILRDLFAEQIGLCGYMGYTNFMRKDWLETILSWQSKSDYGCFVREKDSRVKFISTDFPIKRQATKLEKSEGVVPDEYCFPHFTSVSLTALVSYWDYLEEKCINA